MFTLDQAGTSSQGHYVIGVTSPSAFVQSSCGPSPERSDAYMEWAINFERRLRLAEERIRSWARDPRALEVEDLEPPSHVAVERALEFSGDLRRMVMDRVAPRTAIPLNFKGVSLDTGGEINFELGAGPYAVTYSVESNGTLTGVAFRNGKLVDAGPVRL